jgi:glycine cleavage system pyridoxal-binding protein P
MPFIPHTDADVKAMLKSIGVNSIDQLFDEIPEKLRKLTRFRRLADELRASCRNAPG